MIMPNAIYRIFDKGAEVKFYHKRNILRCNAAMFRGKIKQMTEKKFIEDRERLEMLAPVARAEIKLQVFVCNGKSCSAVGSAEVKAAFERELKAKDLRYGKESKGRNPEGPIVLTDCGSVGFCSVGPAVLVYPEGIWYAQVSPDDVPEIVEEHLLNGKVVERLALKNMANQD